MDYRIQENDGISEAAVNEVENINTGWIDYHAETDHVQAQNDSMEATANEAENSMKTTSMNGDATVSLPNSFPWSQAEMQAWKVEETEDQIIVWNWSGDYVHNIFDESSEGVCHAKRGRWFCHRCQVD